MPCTTNLLLKRSLRTPQNRPQDVHRAKTLFLDHFLKCLGHLNPARKTCFFALKGNISSAAFLRGISPREIYQKSVNFLTPLKVRSWARKCKSALHELSSLSAFFIVLHDERPRQLAFSIVFHDKRPPIPTNTQVTANVQNGQVHPPFLGNLFPKKGSPSKKHSLLCIHKITPF